MLSLILFNLLIKYTSNLNLPPNPLVLFVLFYKVTFIQALIDFFTKNNAQAQRPSQIDLEFLKDIVLGS